MTWIATLLLLLLLLRWSGFTLIAQLMMIRPAQPQAPVLLLLLLLLLMWRRRRRRQRRPIFLQPAAVGAASCTQLGCQPDCHRCLPQAICATFAAVKFSKW